MGASSSELLEHRHRHRTLTLGRLAALVAVSLALVAVGDDLVTDLGWGPVGAAGSVLAVLYLGAWTLPRSLATLRFAGEVVLVGEIAAIAVLLATTGGTASPFAPLLLVEVTAVTLTFGRWAGLRATALAALALGWVWANDLGPRSTDAEPTVQAALLLGMLIGTTVVTGWLSRELERDLRRRTEDLALLHDVTPDLDPRLGPQRIGEVLARLLRDRLGYRRSAIWTATTGGYTALAAAGEGLTVQVPAGWDLPGDIEPLPAVVAAEGLYPIRRDAPRPEALEAAFGAGAPLLLAPLAVEDRPVGFLAVEVPRPRFGRAPVVRGRDAHLLRMLADQAALLLDNARLQADLADLAVTDANTGLPNRRFLEQRLREELDRVGRQAARGDARELSFALFDLDHFKRINDTFGHPAGDRVLSAVASVAERALRGSDVVCRYGGEEFAVLLVDTPAAEAVQACERLRRAIAELRIEALDGRPIPHVTASFGVATVRDPIPSREALLAAADTALYAAKRAGRDRVHRADGVPSVG